MSMRLLSRMYQSLNISSAVSGVGEVEFVSWLAAVMAAARKCPVDRSVWSELDAVGW